MMRRGFTLLELMVASLLLAMLMTILTMIFNQSSIAWTTGLASTAALGDARQDISVWLKRADSTLDSQGETGVQGGLQVISLWNFGDNAGDNPLRTDTQGRTLDFGGVSGLEMFEKNGQLPSAEPPAIGTGGGGAPVNAGDTDTYAVGVAANGPDGDEDTWDDISTFPEDQL